MFLVPSRLILLSTGSNLHYWGLQKWIICVQHNEYHREYYWPSTFFFASVTFSLLGVKPYQGFIHSNWVMDWKRANWNTFLSEPWFWSGCIMYNSHTIFIKIYVRPDMRRPLSFQAYILSLSEYLCLLHGDKLNAKKWCLNWDCFLESPGPRWCSHIYQEAISQSVRHLIYYMWSLPTNIWMSTSLYL